MRISLIAAVCVALPLLGACGSDKDSQPTVTQADLSKTLQAGGLTPKLADCAAKLYVDEGISQDGLRKMTAKPNQGSVADGSVSSLSQDDANKARTAAEKVPTQCMAMPAAPK